MNLDPIGLTEPKIPNMNDFQARRQPSLVRAEPLRRPTLPPLTAVVPPETRMSDHQVPPLPKHVASTSQRVSIADEPTYQQQTPDAAAATVPGTLASPETPASSVSSPVQQSGFNHQDAVRDLIAKLMSEKLREQYTKDLEDIVNATREPDLDPAAFAAQVDAKVQDLQEKVHDSIAVEHAEHRKSVVKAHTKIEKAKVSSGRAWKAMYVFLVLQMAWIAAMTALPKLTSQLDTIPGISTWMIYVGYWGPSALALLLGFIACVSRSRVMLFIHTILLSIVMLGHLGCTIAVMVLEASTLMDNLAMYIVYLACEVVIEIPLVILSIVLLVQWKAAHSTSKVSPLLDPPYVSP